MRRTTNDSTHYINSHPGRCLDNYRRRVRNIGAYEYVEEAVGVEYLPLLIPLILLLMIPTSLILMYFKDEIRLLRIKLLDFFKPKNPLDREIAEEEKEIEYLKSQKAKIDRLERLKREKYRLYQEVETGAHREDMGDKHINRTRYHVNTMKYPDDDFEMPKIPMPELGLDKEVEKFKEDARKEIEKARREINEYQMEDEK